MAENSKRKIFVSYKYADSDVLAIDNQFCTARDYVNEIEKIFNGKEICKFEGEGEDISYLSEETIEQKLYDRIYDTSVLLVLMTAGMMEYRKAQKDQWIPREVCYALKKNTRDGRTSQPNAVLAISIPDQSGNHSYSLTDYQCHRLVRSGNFFDIIGKNMFNKKNDREIRCECGCIVFRGHPSYIPIVKWEDFKGNYDKFVKIAEEIRENESEYEMKKILD